MMAQFAKSTFSHASYATFRPSYPQSLYNAILDYHRGSRSTCIDLGCGHGLVTRSLAPCFTNVIGIDPSSGMLAQARSLTPTQDYPNVSFERAPAESTPFVSDHSVDVVVAGQAAHWFDCSLLFVELGRILRTNGTLAFWAYKDHVFVDYPKATDILNKYAYGPADNLLGPYWSQPERAKVQNLLRDVQPPKGEWVDIERIEYEPGVKGAHSGEGTMFLHKRLTVADCMEYIRTWSAYHAWQENHIDAKKRTEGGLGDVVDDMFDEMRETEPSWQIPDWELIEIEIEWGTGLLLARKR